MTVLIIAVLIMLVGNVICSWAAFKDAGLFAVLLSTVLWWIIGGLIIGSISWGLISCQSGLLRGYSEGLREGYLTKLSKKGVIWKTWEGEMQIGTGQMAALQEPFQFSIPKDKQDIHDTVLAKLGTRVQIKYVEWVVMPFRIGESGYEIVAINNVNPPPPAGPPVAEKSEIGN